MSHEVKFRKVSISSSPVIILIKNDKQEEDTMSSVETLADKLGGEDAVTVAVDDFYKRLVGDETLKKFFEGVDMDR